VDIADDRLVFRYTPLKQPAPATQD